MLITHKEKLIVFWSVTAVQAVLWFTGAIGWVISCVILPGILPINCGSGVVLQRVISGEAPPDLKTGAVLTIHPQRIQEIINASFLLRYSLPPGLVRDGMVIDGIWAPADGRLPGEQPLPLRIVVSSGSLTPRFVCRYSSAAINKLLAENAVKKIRKKKEWIFGSYDLDQYIKIYAFQLESKPNFSVPVTNRQFEFTASGEVRYQFEDGIIQVRTTPFIKLAGGVDIWRKCQDDEGIGLAYNVGISKLDADVSNLAPVFDKKVANDLKRHFVKSLNKSAKKRKFESKRFPETMPLDMIVKIELANP